TPAVPLPGVEMDESRAGREGHDLPPELGPQPISVVEGRTFMFSDQIGDVPPGTIGGLVNSDTRLVSHWVLTINGARFLSLRSGTVNHYSAEFFLTNPELPDLPPNTIGLRRRRLLGDVFHEHLELQSFAGQPVHVQLRLETGTDFADLFEMKHVVRERTTIVRDHAPAESRLAYRYQNEDFQVETVISAHPSADRVEGDDLVWELDLAPDSRWSCDIEIPLNFDVQEIRPGRRRFPLPAGTNDPVNAWLSQAPTVESDSFILEKTIETSRRDLIALRIATRAGEREIMLPAAGLPWFLTLFGRDTLITAYQTIAAGQALSRGVLLALAAYQGSTREDFRDEEPGKILHEVRSGELTRLGEKPHNPYYGTIDATPLWLILLSEYYCWTQDDELVRALRSNAMAALDWIDRYGDRDGDGYLEYQTRSPQGLGNQCWRDSWDGVQFADGSLPVLPIATCETQGYVYDAKIRMAELAEGPLNDPALASRLRSEAALLRQRFNNDFWIDERGGYYAIGLDGDKRKIDSLTSNIGHLLWSGIVPEDRARLVANQLMSDAMFSGWGVRTLSTKDRGYNPIGYHRGTVWPHDNSIIATGLARYGFRDEANRITMALLQAARFSDFRLPEAFSGYPRDFGSFPVPYPTACSPQAWATGAPIQCLRAMLGLRPEAGRVVADPYIPDEIGHVTVRRFNAFGALWELEAVGTKSSVRLSKEEPPSEAAARAAFGRL
ncbi:MAG: amylo-alpha-1,6-glucosidase, partial [Micromonosporaceae bacterium]|nr:amylo-alpha-1,6-glucosidase [Micromonosporaceae bacterium]